ncbi:hypothetical protein DFS34DRAFT_679025 [Phlyctochytrium arcticum]|nr:hypothetical protein DFS34DRAFT_679025 [Phlyctochytrium arcticum]
MPLPNVTFEEAIANHGRITEYREHAGNGNFSVHVESPRGEMFIYTNISRGRLSPHVDGPLSASAVYPRSSSGRRITRSQTPDTHTLDALQALSPVSPLQLAQQQPARSSTPRSSPPNADTFEAAMQEGGKIVEVKQFKTFGIYLKLDGSDKVEHCWNISMDRIDAARAYIEGELAVAAAGGGLRRAEELESNVSSMEKATGNSTLTSPVQQQRRQVTLRSPPTTPSRMRKSKTPTFEELIAAHARIVRITPHIFYSVHVQRANGRVENFNRVSSEKYKKYCGVRGAPQPQPLQHGQLDRFSGIKSKPKHQPQQDPIRHHHRTLSTPENLLYHGGPVFDPLHNYQIFPRGGRKPSLNPYPTTGMYRDKANSHLPYLAIPECPRRRQEQAAQQQQQSWDMLDTQQANMMQPSPLPTWMADTLQAQAQLQRQYQQQQQQQQNLLHHNVYTPTFASPTTEYLSPWPSSSSNQLPPTPITAQSPISASTTSPTTELNKRMGDYALPPDHSSFISLVSHPQPTKLEWTEDGSKKWGLPSTIHTEQHRPGMYHLPNPLSPASPFDLSTMDTTPQQQNPLTTTNFDFSSHFGSYRPAVWNGTSAERPGPMFDAPEPSTTVPAFTLMSPQEQEQQQEDQEQRVWQHGNPSTQALPHLTDYTKNDHEEDDDESLFTEYGSPQQQQASGQRMYLPTTESAASEQYTEYFDAAHDEEDDAEGEDEMDESPQTGPEEHGDDQSRGFSDGEGTASD